MRFEVPASLAADVSAMRSVSYVSSALVSACAWIRRRRGAK